jgi:hypothetical protein
MISEHKINYQFGPPPPGVGPPEIVCFSNQTDFTATRVPGGPEAGQALAFRRPSVTSIYFEQPRMYSAECRFQVQ